jgi:hypothetical protein
MSQRDRSDKQNATRSSGRKLGIPARDLRDADLDRELRHLWRTRKDTVLNGAANAIRAHTDRMLELEHEFIARFPRKTQPAPGRTRRGSRAQEGQLEGRGHPPAPKKTSPKRQST